MKRPLILLTGLVISFLVVWSAYRIERGRARGVSAQSGSNSGNVARPIAGGLVGDPLNSTIPTQLFLEGFDAPTGIDTANKWLTPVAAGGGVVAVAEQTDTRLATGTTANGYSYIESRSPFPLPIPGWLQVGFGNNLPSPPLVNQYLFWGLGTTPATPTASTPLTDAVGFELYTDGGLYAVVYAAGARTVVRNLTAPTDGGLHYYYIMFGGNMDQVYFAIDSVQNIVANTANGATGPANNILPLKVEAIAGTVGPASSGQITVNMVYVGSTAPNVTVDPCQSATVAKQSAQVNITTATTTSLVPVSGTKAVYSCGLKIDSLATIAANTIKLVYGTQTTNPCDTGQVALTPVYNLGLQAAGALPADLTIGNGGVSFVKPTPAGQGVCLVTTVGTGPSINALYTYVQK
jgi:hypothetical protein